MKNCRNVIRKNEIKWQIEKLCKEKNEEENFWRKIRDEEHEKGENKGWGLKKFTFLTLFSTSDAPNLFLF